MKKLLSLLIFLGMISNLQGRNHVADLAATGMGGISTFCPTHTEDEVQMRSLFCLGELTSKSLNIAQTQINQLPLREQLKLATYGLAALYNLYSMTNPEEAVKLSKSCEHKRRKRLCQAALLLEAALRAGAFYLHNIEEHKTADLGVEAADLVGISRLVSGNLPVPQQENKDIKTNPAPTTISHEMVEAPKLSLLRDEGVSASLGIAEISRKVVERLVVEKKQPESAQDEVQKNPDINPEAQPGEEGWSGNPRDGWAKAPKWGPDATPCAEYKAWQKWHREKRTGR